MNAEELIRTAAKGRNIVVTKIVEAHELQKAANKLLLLDEAKDETEAAYNLKVLLAAVYVAGEISGKREERKRRGGRGNYHAAAET